MQDEVISVDATPSHSFKEITKASTAIQKKFKNVESFMDKSGIMMERDVYYMIPTVAMSMPSPEDFAVGTTYGETRIKGTMFKGKNRKERRAEKTLQNRRTTNGRV